MQLQELEPLAHRSARDPTPRLKRWVALGAPLACWLASACMKFTDDLEAKIEAKPRSTGQEMDDVGSDPEAKGPGPHAGDTAEAGAHAQGHTEPTGESLASADFCVPEPDVPILGSSHDFVELDISGARNDISDLQSCGIERDLSSPDVFFAVDMAAGERWHVRVKGVEDRDVALYVLPECDVRTCEAALDHCPAGGSEHFTVVADTSGIRFFGVDGLTHPEAGLQVVVVNPVCGDNKKVHAEACDDGNTINGDGCDELCRIELPAGDAIEVEPNDDPFAANVLPAGEESVTIAGSVGGACDTDVFSLGLETAQHVEFSISDAFGLPCEDAPELTVEVKTAGGLLVRSAHSPGGECPLLHVEDELLQVIEGGQFTVSISSAPGAELFDYRLTVLRHGDGTEHGDGLGDDAGTPNTDSADGGR